MNTGQITVRHVSYVVYGVAFAIAAIVWLALGLGHSHATCLRLATAATSSETLANLSALEKSACKGAPFDAIRDAFATEQSEETASDDQATEPNEATAPADESNAPDSKATAPADESTAPDSKATVPDYDANLIVTESSVRAWAVVFAVLIAATGASAVAGALFAPFTVWRDARIRGWVWGLLLASLGVVVAYLVNKPVTPEFFTAFHGAREVNFTGLMDPLLQYTMWVTLGGGAFVVAAIVALGHEVNRRNGLDTRLSVEDYRRANYSATLLLYSLAGTLSLGVLATSARFRLLEVLPGVGRVPGTISLLYGGTFSLLIAALWIPTHSRLHAAQERLVGQLAGRNLDCADVLAHRSAVRAELATLSGAAAPGSLVTVFGPVLTAAATSILT